MENKGKLILTYGLTNNSPSPPVMKAVPKVHKQNIPIRPVINCINSPNYKVSKFITTILKQINLINKFTVKNSLELANKLKEIKITDETKISSFDMKKI